MSKFYYHATSLEASKSIQKQGFRCSKKGMNGTCVYFADNPVSAVFKSRTIDPGAIIVVKVNTGRLTIETVAHPEWNLNKIKAKGFDCVQTNCKSGPEIGVYEPWRITIVEIYYLKEKVNNHSKYVHETNRFKTIDIDLAYRSEGTFLFKVTCIMKSFSNEKKFFGGCDCDIFLISKNFTLF